jgi:hypothetical protein
MPTQPNLLPVYRHADRLLIIALWAMPGFSLALTGMHDTMKWSLLAGLPIVVIASGATFLADSGPMAWRRSCASSGSTRQARRSWDYPERPTMTTSWHSY